MSVLVKKEGIRLLSGNEAIARGAFEAGVKVASAYPGTPSTEILENFVRYEGVYAEWAPNEKVAVEVAIGASMGGVRALATMKHVGVGLRMHPVLGIFKTHEGLDIVNDVGTPVYASADGIVSMAGQSGGGYGTVVVINHGYDYQTLYAHLSKVLVHDGQRVRRGDLIAKSGKTGLVSGPHLHYEVRYKGVCKNPVDFFFDDVRPGAFQRNLASR